MTNESFYLLFREFVYGVMVDQWCESDMSTGRPTSTLVDNNPIFSLNNTTRAQLKLALRDQMTGAQV